MTSKAFGLAQLGNAYADGALSNRNLVINGAMQVWQRGTSRVFSDTQYVTVDRFQPGLFQQAGYERTTVSGAGPDAQYALRVTSSSTSEAASGTRMVASQMIESVNCQPVIGKQVTLSFWVKFSAASFTNFGNFLYEVWEYNAVDPSFASTFSSRATQGAITNGSLPTGWTKFSLTTTINAATNTIAVRFGFADLASTANNSDLSYDITEVQLEAGDTATPFEHRSYGQELALCQRYAINYRSAEANGPYYRYGYGDCVTSTRMDFKIDFPVSMRAIPSLTTTGTAANYGVYSRASVVALSSVPSLGGDGSAPYSANVVGSTAGGLTQGSAGSLLSNNNSTSFLLFTAEL